MKRFMLLFSVAVLSFTGCGPENIDPKPAGYLHCSYDPLIKDSNGQIYINKDGDALYRLDGKKIVKSNFKLNDFVTVDYKSGRYVSDKINIENRYYELDTEATTETVISSKTHIIMYDKNKITTIKEFIDSYYKNKIDLNAILADLKKVTYMGKLAISMYPDGMYIIYVSQEDDPIKDEQNDSSGNYYKNNFYYYYYFGYKHNRNASQAAYMGRKMSHYRYYPVNNPQKYIDGPIPCDP